MVECEHNILVELVITFEDEPEQSVKILQRSITTGEHLLNGTLYIAVNSSVLWCLQKPNMNGVFIKILTKKQNLIQSCDICLTNIKLCFDSVYDKGYK